MRKLEKSEIYGAAGAIIAGILLIPIKPFAMLPGEYTIML